MRKDSRREKDRSGVIKHRDYLGYVPVLFMLNIAKFFSVPTHRCKVPHLHLNSTMLTARDQEAMINYSVILQNKTTCLYRKVT